LIYEQINLTGLTIIHKHKVQKFPVHHLSIPCFGNLCRCEIFLYALDMHDMLIHSGSGICLAYDRTPNALVFAQSFLSAGWKHLFKYPRYILTK